MQEVFQDQDTYAKAVVALQEAASAYYDGSQPVMDDAAYDALLAQVAATESQHPSWMTGPSVSQQVAGGASKGGDVVHASPMLSLDNVFSQTELQAWEQTLRRAVGSEIGSYVVEPKLDGLAISAQYRGGLLQVVATRGDGAQGEDVSHNAGWIRGLPAQLSSPVDLEVRGECVLTEDEFTKANQRRLARGARAFVNPRNAAAGMLRLKDHEPDAELTFFAYAAPSVQAPTHLAVMEELVGLGIATTLRVAAPLTVCPSLADVWTTIEKFAAQRSQGLGLDIDGAVVKVNETRVAQRAGSTSRAPRWAVAYKYPPDSRLTTLLDIKLQMGRTGAITPVAVLAPVFVGGTTITSATLHNADEVARKDVRIGDQVWVRRAGEVVPEIVAVHLPARPKHAVAWAPPATCPGCGGDIIREQKVWRCAKGRGCALAQTLYYAASRKCLDIEGLGQTLIDRLVESGRVTSLADIFTLAPAEVAEMERVGPVLAAKVCAQIDRARQMPLHRFLGALGIRLIGTRMTARVCVRFPTFALLRNATTEQLSMLEGFGPARAASLKEELIALGPVLDQLEAIGVSPVEPAQAKTDGGPLTGLRVVVTGSIAGLTRTGAQEAIVALGGTASSSVSSVTNLVVIGEGGGSKATKAAALGIKTMTGDQFLALLEESRGSSNDEDQEDSNA